MLAKLDFGGLYQWVFIFVCPTILHYQDAAHLDFCTFRWVMRVALDSVSDLPDQANNLKQSLGQKFNLDILAEQPSSIPNNTVFRIYDLLGFGESTLEMEGEADYSDHRPYNELDYHRDSYAVSDRCLDFDRDKFNAPTQTKPVRHTYLQVLEVVYLDEQPEKDDLCPVCRLTFDEPGSCHRIKSCHHPYHEDCLQRWLNTFREGDVPCPYCRQCIGVVEVWTAADERREGVETIPAWSDPDWWQAQVRGRLGKMEPSTQFIDNDFEQLMACFQAATVDD